MKNNQTMAMKRSPQKQSFMMQMKKEQRDAASYMNGCSLCEETQLNAVKARKEAQEAQKEQAIMNQKRELLEI